MQHTYFELRNFKGIVKTRLDFTSRPQGNVYPCVGLNESGKTTILEGLRDCCKIPYAHRFNNSRIMLIWIIAALLAVNLS